MTTASAHRIDDGATRPPQSDGSDAAQPLSIFAFLSKFFLWFATGYLAGFVFGAACWFALMAWSAR